MFRLFLWNHYVVYTDGQVYMSQITIGMKYTINDKESKNNSAKLTENVIVKKLIVWSQKQWPTNKIDVDYRYI